MSSTPCSRAASTSTRSRSMQPRWRQCEPTGSMRGTSMTVRRSRCTSRRPGASWGRAPDRYDVIVLALVKTEAIGAGGLSLVEDYAFTEEAVAEYHDHLTEAGRIAFFVHHEAALAKVVATAINVSADKGDRRPGYPELPGVIGSKNLDPGTRSVSAAPAAQEELPSLQPRPWPLTGAAERPRTPSATYRAPRNRAVGGDPQTATQTRRLCHRAALPSVASSGRCAVLLPIRPDHPARALARVVGGAGPVVAGTRSSFGAARVRQAGGLFRLSRDSLHARSKSPWWSASFSG